MDDVTWKRRHLLDLVGLGLAALPRGPAQAAAVCARTADDAIHKLFCHVTPPLRLRVMTEEARELAIDALRR